MKRIVVDASVVAKWYLPEVYSQQALLLLNSSFQLLTPDHLYSEIGNLLWKRVARKNLLNHLDQIADARSDEGEDFRENLLARIGITA